MFSFCIRFNYKLENIEMKNKHYFSLPVLHPGHILCIKKNAIKAKKEVFSPSKSSYDFNKKIYIFSMQKNDAIFNFFNKKYRSILR